MVEAAATTFKNTYIAVVRVRGDALLSPHIKKTFKITKLYGKNYCVVIPNTPEFLGIIQRIKDHTTFGEISSDTFLKLLQKRGRLAGNKPLTDDYVKQKLRLDIKQFVAEFFAAKQKLENIPGLKTFFRLHPPIGGFERAGIKKNYAVGGALGYRGKYINKLIERMI